MKKIFLILLFTFFVSSVFAYTSTSQDDQLLSAFYQKIDTVLQPGETRNSLIADQVEVIQKNINLMKEFFIFLGKLQIISDIFDMKMVTKIVMKILIFVS